MRTKVRWRDSGHPAQHTIPAFRSLRRSPDTTVNWLRRFGAHSKSPITTGSGLAPARRVRPSSRCACAWTPRSPRFRMTATIEVTHQSRGGPESHRECRIPRCARSCHPEPTDTGGVGAQLATPCRRTRRAIATCDQQALPLQFPLGPEITASGSLQRPMAHEARKTNGIFAAKRTARTVLHAPDREHSIGNLVSIR